MDKNKLISEIIRRGFTPKQVRDMTGIKDTTWFARVNGEREFHRDEIDAIARLLNLTPEEMCDIFFTK